MATPRSPSFYTNFFRAVRSCQPTTYQSIRCPPANSSGGGGSRGISRRPQSTYPNRYGPAATEGLPPPPKPSESLELKQVEPEPRPKPKESEKQEARSESQEKEEQVNSTAEDVNEQEDPVSESQVASEQKEPDYQPEKELNMVLQIPSPSEIKGKTSRHPHLEPSPYEHHFDTYGLVQQLSSEDSSFTLDQATTLMKAIRLQLALNLEIAKDGLVSKSDIENESYLFRAACSELRTTLQSSRFAENQRQRTGRAHLQHEFDILNQKVNQDILTMREELKGMFNDRKMGLQEEKRKVDSKISELNYEITVLLNSEAKSEVEGLRWVLTRRAAMAIGTAAFMTLCALQYYSIMSRENAEIERRRKTAQKAQDERIFAADSSRYTTPSRSQGTQTDVHYDESLG